MGKTNRENECIYIKVPVGTRDKLEYHARISGDKTINSFIMRLIEDEFRRNEEKMAILRARINSYGDEDNEYRL